MTKLRKLLSFALPILFITNVLAMSMFVHVHDTGSGRVVHSHPFANAGHTHSSGELCVIGALSHYALTDALPHAVGMAAHILCIEPDYHYEAALLADFRLSDCSLRRAPPVI